MTQFTTHLTKFLKLFKRIPESSVISLLLLICLLSLITKPSIAEKLESTLYGFSFGGYGGTYDITLLDYDYGEFRARNIYGNNTVGQRLNTFFNFPPARFLHVKWRINSTDKVYEETADLQGRLPRNMTGYTIYFALKGGALYVYLISSRLREPGASGCPERAYRDFRCARIYPDVQTY